MADRGAAPGLKALRVRAAVGQGRRHPADKLRVYRMPRIRVNDARNTTHGLVPPPGARLGAQGGVQPSVGPYHVIEG